jgi:hypothetical protein
VKPPLEICCEIRLVGHCGNWSSELPTTAMCGSADVGAPVGSKDRLLFQAIAAPDPLTKLATVRQRVVQSNNVYEAGQSSLSFYLYVRAFFKKDVTCDNESALSFSSTSGCSTALWLAKRRRSCSGLTPASRAALLYVSTCAYRYVASSAVVEPSRSNACLSSRWRTSRRLSTAFASRERRSAISTGVFADANRANQLAIDSLDIPVSTTVGTSGSSGLLASSSVAPRIKAREQRKRANTGKDELF